MPEIQMENIIPILIQWGATHGLKILLILIGMYIAMKIIHKIISGLISSTVRKTYNNKSQAALEKRETTLHQIAHMAVKALIFIIGGLMVLSEFGINTAPLLGAAGIAGLAFGFGGQYLIRDLISGLFIILEDQYRVGDVVKIAGTSGVVKAITLRDTVLRDLDGIEHHVPNGEINTVANYTKFWARAHLNIPVAYSTNLEHARDVLNKVGKEMAEDEKWKDDFSPIDEMDNTWVDTEYSKAYLRHLFSVNEFLGKQIATIHNLGFYLWLTREARKQILAGTFRVWKDKMVKQMDKRL